MLRVAIRNLIAHKVRTLALMFTVVLGVSFVVGTYVLTDTITHVFDDIFTDVYAGTDVSVRHSSALGSDAVRPPIPASVLDEVRTVPGVRVAEGGVLATGVDIIDADGDRVGNAQAPTFGATWSQDPSLTPFTFREGRRPAGSNEVAIDATSFAAGHFHLGDQVLLVTAAGPDHFTLVGVAGFGRASNLAGATMSIFDLPTAQALLGRPDAFDSINIAAQPGTSTEVLQQRVAAVLTADQEAVTGADLSSEGSSNIGSMLGFFRTFMLVFTFVALFVGAFIVYNTYSIVIAARTRELALVRALGASGAGVLFSVLVEALLTGVLAAGVGIGAGVLLASGLRRLLDTFGFGMPSGDMVLLGRTVWVALIGGAAVTVIASIVPALRAARIAPLAAMQESALGRRSGLGRNLVGGLLTIGGIIAILLGLDRGTLSAVGAGAGALFIGMAMLAPLLSVPVVALLGMPIERARGVAGLLACQNARRNPRRTTTASALMVGTALMAGSFVLSRSITESVDRAVNGSAVADLVLTSNNQAGFSAALANEVEQMPNVRAVTRYRVGQFKLGNATKHLAGLPTSAVDPTTQSLAIDVHVVDGDISQLADAGIAVQADVARDRGWSVGDTITATMPTGDQPLRIVATYHENTLVGDFVIDLRTFDRAYVDTTDFLVMVLVDDTSTIGAVQASIKDLVASSYPGLNVQTKAEYVAASKARVAQFTSLITALLTLAVAIALLGVLITMLLSVAERRREIGLLRAVGMSRGQTRSVIRWEAAIVALYGALLGVALGIFLGLAFVKALENQGVTTSVVPALTLIVLTAVITLLGVLASVYPARRAARMNVIAAVAAT